MAARRQNGDFIAIASQNLSKTADKNDERQLTPLKLRPYSPDMTAQSFTAHAIASSTADELAARLGEISGPYVRLSELWFVLGFCSVEAARKAASRNQLPVSAVRLPERRGIFISTVELADWLYQATRRQADTKTTQQTKEEPPMSRAQ